MFADDTIIFLNREEEQFRIQSNEVITYHYYICVFVTYYFFVAHSFLFKSADALFSYSMVNLPDFLK